MYVFTLMRIFTQRLVIYRVAGSSLCSTCAGGTLQRPGKSLQTLGFFFQHVSSGSDSKCLSSCQGEYFMYLCIVFICVYLYIASFLMSRCIFYMYIYLCIVFLCVYLYIVSFLMLRLYLYIYVCIFICIHIYVYICMYTCVFTYVFI